MAQEVLSFKIKGLHTNPNQLSSIPEGALAKAMNCVIDKEGVIEPRRGFGREVAFAGASNRADVLSTYETKIITHRSDDNVVSFFNGTSFVDYAGTYSHPDPLLARIRFAEMNGNKYFTTSNGVMMLDNVNGPVYTTGTPKGLDGTAVSTGASGFQANITQVAYRIVWGSRDVQQNLYLGSPSQRILCVNNSGATRDVLLTFTIPAGIATTDFFQVYRSNGSSGVAVEANDELQLVYEGNPSAAQITAKTVTLTDSTSDTLKGAALYSNALQEGITESNEVPPYASDITPFKNFMFFANIRTKHGINIKLLSAGGSLGLALNDTITINSMVFTAKAAETVASREFQLSTGGTAAQNIDDTARSLVRVINQAASNTTIYSYYTSGFSDLPGQFRCERRDLLTTLFTVSTSKATAFNLGDGNSTNSNFQNAVMWSKIQQPEHVPSSHLEYIGSKSQPIRRIVALQNSLLIFKDDGIFRLTGVNGSWLVEEFDKSTVLIAPETAVVLNNQVYCLANVGVVLVGDSGVGVIDLPISDKVTSLIGSTLTNLKTLSFAVSYPTEKKYILFMPSISSDLNATQALVWNTFSQTWTEWNKISSHGIVSTADDRLYLASPDTKWLLKERKAISFRDFIDEELDGFTLSSFSGSVLTLNTVSALSIGDLFFQSALIFSTIASIDVALNQVTLVDSKLWTLGAIQVFKAIDCTVEWALNDCGNASVEKRFQLARMNFRDEGFFAAIVSFYTDYVGSYTTSRIFGRPVSSGLWGGFQWGAGLWGGISRARNESLTVPREASRGTMIGIRFGVRSAYSKWALNGFALFFEDSSERANRD